MPSWSKWRLTKADRTHIEERVQAKVSELIAQGVDNDAAEEEGNSFRNLYSVTCLQEKAERAAARANPGRRSGRRTPPARPPAADPPLPVGGGGGGDSATGGVDDVVVEIEAETEATVEAESEATLEMGDLHGDSGDSRTAEHPAKDNKCGGAGGHSYLAALDSDIQVIQNHFKGIGSMPPSKIQRGQDEVCGIQEPFHAQSAKTALGRQGAYIAGINVFSLDLHRSAAPGVPLSRKRVAALGDHLFPDGPAFLTMVVTVAVHHKELQATIAEGSLRVISPEEVAHALLYACAKHIGTTPPLEDLLPWRDVLLSVPCCFQLLANEQFIYMASYNLRQQVMQKHESMRRTAFQMAHEVVSFKANLEALQGKKLQPADVAAAYKEQGGNTAQGSDQITTHFVLQAQQVHDKIAKDSRLVAVLAALEDAFGTQSCLNSMVKLTLLAQKTANTRTRVWVMEGLLDLVLTPGLKSPLLENEDITKMTLQGDKSHTGLIALLEVKYQIMQHWLDVELPKHGFSDADRRLIRETTASHSVYRAKVATSSAADVSWMGSMAQSSILALQFIEANAAVLRLPCVPSS